MNRIPAVSGSQLCMSFNGVPVVRGVDIAFYPGEVHAIIGENGAGKSTLAKLIAGVHTPVSGEIQIENQPVKLQNPLDALQKGIALIHQEPLMFPDLDVAESVFVGHQPMRGMGIDWKPIHARTAEILTSLGVGFGPATSVRSLNVADQQMVELAAALSHDAKVLFLDETTASLTGSEVSKLFGVIRQMRDSGRSIGFVSHHLEEVMEIADRISIMRDGEKVYECRPQETSVADLATRMVGRDLAASVIISKPDFTSDPVLKVDNLGCGKRFQGVSLKVHAGEIVGLAGLVGAGRTDVCLSIFGVTPATEGTIEFSGKPVRTKTPRDGIDLGMALVPEDRQHQGLLLTDTILGNSMLAALQKVSKRGWRNPKAERERSQTHVQTMRTKFADLDQNIGELSGGNQQKVVLAKWLMTNPKLLILDEPTRGVDIGAKAEVHAEIRALVDQGLAILLVSSDLPELLSLSDRVLVMREGRVTAELSKEEATEERVMLAATGADHG